MNADISGRGAKSLPSTKPVPDSMGKSGVFALLNIKIYK